MSYMNLNRLAACISILILVGTLLLPLTFAQTNTSDVRVQLNGPSTLGTLRSGTYSATFVDPLSRIWSYKVYITAANTTGASPLKDTPTNGTITATNNSFTFEVTAQQSPGELEIHLNCTTGSVNYEKVQRINVVYPISLKAKINNPTNMEISNATATFYVDGTEIDKQTIQTIAANQAVDIESEWIAYNKETGWHDSKIVIDINNDGVIDTQAGDMVINDRFYIKGGSNWTFILIVLIGLIALITGFGYISKQKLK